MRCESVFEFISSHALHRQWEIDGVCIWVFYFVFFFFSESAQAASVV